MNVLDKNSRTALQAFWNDFDRYKVVSGVALHWITVEQGATVSTKSEYQDKSYSYWLY